MRLPLVLQGFVELACQVRLRLFGAGESLVRPLHNLVQRAQVPRRLPESCCGFIERSPGICEYREVADSVRTERFDRVVMLTIESRRPGILTRPLGQVLEPDSDFFGGARGGFTLGIRFTARCRRHTVFIFRAPSLFLPLIGHPAGCIQGTRVAHLRAVLERLDDGERSLLLPG